MKKIINERMYNTETATEIDWQENTANRGDYSYYREYLYRKKTGEFFLYGYGMLHQNIASLTLSECVSQVRKSFL